MLALPLVSLLSLALPLESAPSLHQELQEIHHQTPSFLEEYRPQALKNADEPNHGFDKVVYGYLPYWADLEAPIPWEHLTHLAYFSVEMNADGSLGEDHGWESYGGNLVAAGESHGVQVVLTATLMDDEGIRSLLQTAPSRQAAIDNLLAKVQAVNGHGINIDFEFSRVKNSFVIS